MFKQLKSWWNELNNVRPFVTAFVDEFNNNRGRFRVYRDDQLHLVFDKYCKVFYPIWLRDDFKQCRCQANGCQGKEWIKNKVEEVGYTIGNVEWTTFLTHKEEAYLYRYCYKLWRDKHQKGVNDKMKAKKQAFNVKLLNRYSK